ncbi:uncharacterized protein LOC124316552 isoform X2 [Daphnia pulicaria]|uniref:uncharacterized protein LOC124316552 isoform X2 n=1 Tax=Daphnia pulicaria TaxID=35523 RepID=UPI001EEC79A5|nr:uncharacterized protein LOC124316552 isoform X2 [Daphnia pulicaria]
MTILTIKAILRSYVASHPQDPWILPDTASQDNKEPYGMNIMESKDVFGEGEFPDAQSRIKGFNRHRPLLFPAKSPKDPRVVINLASQSNFFIREMKMITFTMTSCVTIITSVQSCIPSADFSPVRLTGLVAGRDAKSSKFAASGRRNLNLPSLHLMYNREYNKYVQMQL